MTTLDAGTRARLADALEGATPEMLREDAAEAEAWALVFAEVTSLSTENRFAPRLLRLAALALAVAEMQGRTDFCIEKAGEAVYVDHGPRIDFRGPLGDSLPAALAALLRTPETTR